MKKGGGGGRKCKGREGGYVLTIGSKQHISIFPTPAQMELNDGMSVGTEGAKRRCACQIKSLRRGEIMGS